MSFQYLFFDAYCSQRNLSLTYFISTNLDYYPFIDRVRLNLVMLFYLDLTRVQFSSKNLVRYRVYLKPA